MKLDHSRSLLYFELLTQAGLFDFFRHSRNRAHVEQNLKWRRWRGEYVTHSYAMLVPLYEQKTTVFSSSKRPSLPNYACMRQHRCFARGHRDRGLKFTETVAPKQAWAEASQRSNWWRKSSLNLLISLLQNWIDHDWLISCNKRNHQICAKMNDKFRQKVLFSWKTSLTLLKESNFTNKCCLCWKRSIIFPKT